MWTVKDFVASQQTKWDAKEVHLHALDVLQYILVGDADPKRTVFGCKRPAWEHFNDMKKALSEHCETSGLDVAEENFYRPEQRTREVRSDMGEINIERMLERDEQMFDEPIKIQKNMPGVTIILDWNLPYRDRDRNYMKRRHQKIYDLVMKLEGDGHPVRVLGVICMSCTETSKRKSGVGSWFCFMTIKHWDDPIFPGIWGALKNNLATNCLLNTFMDFVIGTHDPGNGTCQYGDIKDLIPEDEEVCIIESTFITYGGVDDNYTEYMDR